MFLTVYLFQKGSIEIVPQSGFSMQTDFKISSPYNIDNDQSLSYKFSIYICEEDYLKEIQLGQNPMASLVNTLQDFTLSNILITKLPEPLKKKVYLPSENP